MKVYKVGIVDDHTLIRNGLAELINTFDDYEVLFQAGNYDEVIEQISAGKLPHIMLLDINMPGKDGYDVSLWLKENHPGIKTCALSMHDNEISIIRMLKNGVRGYLLKACQPNELKLAMDSILKRGYHYSELLTGHLVHSVQCSESDEMKALQLNEKEITFLKYACTEMSYKEIGSRMFLSPRTIDGYQNRLCEKLNVNSRIGLVLYAIKSGIVSL